MKEKELKELKLTKNVIIPFPNFQQNTIISPTQMNDNFEEIEYAYNNLIDNHNSAITKINEALAEYKQKKLVFKTKNKELVMKMKEEQKRRNVLRCIILILMTN